jgi:hypothetical protein
MNMWPIRQLIPDPSEVISPMSQAAWCNFDDPDTNVIGQIGHSFNADDPDRQHFTQTKRVNVPTGNSYGQATYQERQEVTEVIDFCGYHWEKQNPFRAREPIALPATTVADIDTAEMEAATADADMWRARYEAEKARRKASED